VNAAHVTEVSGIERPGRHMPIDRGVPFPRRVQRWFGRNLLRLFVVLVFAYLFTPIAYITVFSFNDGGRSNIVWQGFTLSNWTNPCRSPELCPAVGNSLEIGVISTFLATLLGTMIAYALSRYRFRGRTITNLLIFLPMATPEVVMAASLLTLFLNLRVNLGFTTIVVAHVMFCVSFVVVAVKARIASLDPRLEQAAMDLYANEAQAFRKVTLPLLAPGIAGAALLAFSLSFDDFIVTTFNSGNVNTFPKFVYVAAKRGVPPEAYVVGAGMFYLALLLAVLAEVLRQVRARA